MAGPLQHPKKGSSQNPEVTYVEHYVLPRLALTEIEGCWSSRNVHSSNYIVDPDEIGDQEDLDLQDPGAPGVAALDARIGVHGPLHAPEHGHPQEVPPEESMTSFAGSSVQAEMSVDSVPGPPPVVPGQLQQLHGQQPAAPPELQPDAAIAALPHRPNQSVGRGRTFRDPRSSKPPHRYPFCQGAGKRSSWLSTEFRKFPREDMVETAEAAHTLLIHDAEPGDLVPPQGDDILMVAQYVHFHRCRLNKWCLLSSKYTAEYKATEDRRSLGASFALATIPDHIRDRVVCSTPAALQPVQIRSFAILEWEGVAALQRVAYVKVLEHVRVELVAGSGQDVVVTNGQQVSEWADKGQQCCIPLDNLYSALLVVKPPEQDLWTADGRWVLIPFQGKKFGMVYDVADEANDELIAVD